MALDNGTAQLIAAAIASAGCIVRGSRGTEDHYETVRQTLEGRELPEDAVEAVLAITNALVGFADAVRKAERDGRPIMPNFDDTP